MTLPSFPTRLPINRRSKVLLQSVILFFGALWGLSFCSQHAAVMKFSTLAEAQEQQIDDPQLGAVAQVRRDLKRDKCLSQLTAADNAELHPRIPDAVQRVPPIVQVFVTTAPSLGKNWELFYLSSNGWHTQFPDLQVFTFDEVVDDSPIHVVIEELPKLNGEKSERHSNLLLAAIGASYRRNPNSKWYLLAEDDTIVARTSLEDMVSKLDPNIPQMIGKCVRGVITNVPFVVGGAGMLLSHALVADLAPHIDACRLEMNEGYGDARVSRCIMKHNLTWNPESTCPPEGYRFADFHIATRDDKFVTLHRKEPALIQHVNEAVLALSANSSAAVTLGSLFDHFKVASGKEFAELSLL